MITMTKRASLKKVTTLSCWLTASRKSEIPLFTRDIEKKEERKKRSYKMADERLA